MWLLDHNIPHQLSPALKSKGISCKTVFELGWHELKNGTLISRAINHNFICILTKDIKFIESAYSNKTISRISIVLINIQQVRGKEYAEKFINCWNKKPFTLQNGKHIIWPY